jgi:hypothetical protein
MHRHQAELSTPKRSGGMSGFSVFTFADHRFRLNQSYVIEEGHTHEPDSVSGQSATRRPPLDDVSRMMWAE